MITPDYREGIRNDVMWFGRLLRCCSNRLKLVADGVAYEALCSHAEDAREAGDEDWHLVSIRQEPHDAKVLRDQAGRLSELATILEATIDDLHAIRSALETSIPIIEDAAAYVDVVSKSLAFQRLPEWTDRAVSVRYADACEQAGAEIMVCRHHISTFLTAEAVEEQISPAREARAAIRTVIPVQTSAEVVAAS